MDYNGIGFSENVTVPHVSSSDKWKKRNL